MGIRLALGASRGRLYGLVFRHRFTLTVVAIGIAGSAGAARVLGGLLFNTAPTE